jgi:hypothetical protein
MLAKHIQTLLLTTALASLSIGCQAPNTAKTATDGFRPLFNGKDFKGWVNVNCAPETWSVTNGLIHCTGKPIGALRTDRQYENYILELEWRHLKSAGNAGVFIWSSPISWPGVPFLRAVEVQVLDHGYGKSDWFTTHGDVFPIHGSTMEPFGRHNGMRSFPAEERSKGTPEWNHYRIVATNGVLRLSVNGKEVSGGSNCNWRKGYIGLESEGSPVEFRNIRIQEFPSSGATAEQSAPAETDWKALYNGVDLRGWKSENLAAWQSADWRLLVKPDGQAKAPLLSEKTYGDLELIVDFKAPDKLPANGPLGGIVVAGKTAVSFGAGKAPIVIAGDKLKAKAWHRVRLSKQNGKLNVYLNNELIESAPFTETVKGQWPVGLANEGQALEYANIYVRELK